MFGDNDLPIFFSDMGVPVSWNNQTAQGILDQATDAFSHGGGPGSYQRSTLILRFPYNAFSGIPQPRDPITVNGGPFAGSYTVLEMPPQQDAQIVELYLKVAAS